MGALQKVVGNMLDGMSKTEDLMEEIGMHMVDEIQAAMDAEETFDGEKWPEGNRSGQALRNTSKLWGAIAYEATGDSVAVGVGQAAADRHPEVHNEGMTIRPKNKKALKFQLPNGTWRTVKKVVIPKREFVPDFGESTRAQDEIRELCSEYMQEIMGIK
ncbi:MAG: phage virion morphogenesis protein [Deferribacterales bacterium]